MREEERLAWTCRLVGGVFVVDVDELRGRSSAHPVAEARAYAVYLLREHIRHGRRDLAAPVSYEAIGAYLGGRKPEAIRHMACSLRVRLARSHAARLVLGDLHECVADRLTPCGERAVCA